MSDKRLKLKWLPYKIMTAIIDEQEIKDEKWLKEIIDCLIYFFEEEFDECKKDDKERIRAWLWSLIRVLKDFDNNKEWFNKLKRLYFEWIKSANKQINNKEIKRQEINKTIKALKTTLAKANRHEIWQIKNNN
jgi:hypothetical protein